MMASYRPNFLTSTARTVIAPTIIDKRIMMRWGKAYAQWLRLDEGIERAAKSNVEAYLTETRNFYPLIAKVEKRRDITERHLSHVSAFHRGLGVNCASGYVD